MNKTIRIVLPIVLSTMLAGIIGYSVFRAHASELNTTSLLNDANLKAYYRFETDDGTDTKGNYNLTVNGNPTFTTGKYGKGINLGSSNTSTYASINSNLGVSDAGPLTISAWVKLAAEPSSGSCVAIANLGVATNYIEWMLEYCNASGNYQVRFRRVRQNVSIQTATYDVDLGTTLWHHLALVHDGTNMWGFVDGNKSSSVAATGNGGSNVENHFEVGREHEQGGDYGELSGIIDDDAVFNDWLTDGEVATLQAPDEVTLTAVRTTDKDVSSSATPLSDDQLTLTLQPKTYIIDGVVFAKSASVAPGIKFDFSATSASSLAIGYIAANGTINTGGILTATGSTAIVLATANSVIPIHLSGTVTMSKYGDVVFQWAQNVSDNDAIMTCSPEISPLEM